MAKKDIARDYVVLHDGIGSGVNGPALVKGDEVGPGDFEDGFDFDRLIELKAVGLKSEALTETRFAQERANAAQEPVFQVIAPDVSENATVPAGETSASPVNPETKSPSTAA